MSDFVVLVDKQDNELGVIEKLIAHNDNTPLHRGLSVYLFNDKNQVIVQQRADCKKTWPGVWSNSCCGHPKPGESYIDAARREVQEELGIKIYDLRKVSDYKYTFERNGIVENEICPVFKGIARGEVALDPSEVKDWKWIDWDEWMEVLKTDKPGAEGVWSEWCKEEVLLLDPPGTFK
jgi:isopentenyl-diphosphate delta-isomerase